MPLLPWHFGIRKSNRQPSEGWPDETHTDFPPTWGGGDGGGGGLLNIQGFRDFYEAGSSWLQIALFEGKIDTFFMH